LTIADFLKRKVFDFRLSLTQEIGVSKFQMKIVNHLTGCIDHMTKDKASGGRD